MTTCDTAANTTTDHTIHHNYGNTSLSFNGEFRLAGYLSSMPVGPFEKRHSLKMIRGRLPHLQLIGKQP